jgi:hypothetical protein
MKKLILILAILVVASPAFAALDVNIVKLTGNQVQIRYTGADGNNLPRGFALAFEVNSTADVCGISAYKVGESNSTNRGFGIYPAKIQFANPDQNKPSGWGDPLADQNDPLPTNLALPADQVLPSKCLVLEFGSLYSPVGVGSANAPGADGNLCTLSFEPNASTRFTIKMTGEGQFRITNGATATTGVIFEDRTTADVNKTLTITTDCFPSGYSTYPNWVTMGKPACWCTAYQCDGDADGIDSGGFDKFRIFTGDLNLIIANWKKKIGDYPATLNPCADIDHKDSGGFDKFRVFTADLNKVIANWKKKNAGLPGDCPRAE